MDSYQTITTRSGQTYKYNKFDEIGRGSFGKVYHTSSEIDGACALKVIPKSKLEDMKEYLYDALKREIKIQKMVTLSKLPFFVALYDDGEDQENFYLLLELCDGTIKKYLKKSLSETDCLHVVLQVGIGLAFMHAKKIAHRDIKIDNIFIREGIAKIGDFGFSTNCDKLTTNLGTPPYMSPEFFTEEEGAYSVKVDVWALNTCLYYMLSGKYFFSHIDKNQLKRMVKDLPFSLLPELSAKLSSKTQCLLYRGYTKDEKHRPSMLEYLMDPVFDELRSPYVNILLKIFNISNISPPPELLHPRVAQPLNIDPRFDHVNKADRPVAQTEPKILEKKLLNYRNNILEYSKTAKIILQNKINKIFVFLLYKRHLQFLGLALSCFIEKTVPKFPPFLKLNIQSNQWMDVVDGPYAKSLIGLFLDDLLEVKARYCEVYKEIFKINQQKPFMLPSFDISIKISKSFNDYLDDLSRKLLLLKLSTPESEKITNCIVNLQHFEKFDFEQLLSR